MTIELTKAERAVLSGGFCAPRPGNNFFPLLELKKGGVTIEGERIDALIRAGLLVGSPVSKPKKPIKGGDLGPHGEIPDIEITHRYALKTATGQG